MEWITKKYSRVLNGGSDVSLSLSNPGINSGRVVIRFRNDVYLKITKNEFLKCGLQGTRLYFKETSPTEGFKLTSFNKNKSSCLTRISEELLPISDTKIELGDYKLQYDPNLKMYYIDGLNKIKYE